MFDYKQWRHVFKLDPNKTIDDKTLENVCLSGTDAIIVGGSDGVTFDNTIDLLAKIRRFSVPCVLEISSLDVVTPGFDYYFVPTVLNSNAVTWVKGMHHRAVKEFGHLLNWDELVMEGYCVLNGESKVAELTDADTNLSEDDVVAYATMAENMFRLPIFYLEYSGSYGDVELVKNIAAVLTETKLFYGGGIDCPEKASEMARYADTIVVGNAIYEQIDQALQTVKAVKKE